MDTEVRGLAAMNEDWAATILQMQNESNRQIGILIGKVDGINDRLDKLNSAVAEHERRLGDIEQTDLGELKKNVEDLQNASLTNAGATRVKRNIWKYTWQIIGWFGSAATGSFITWLFLRGAG